MRDAQGGTWDRGLRQLAGYYGGLGLLAWDVGRNLALPRAYFPLVVQELDVMGVRSLTVANLAAIFTGMVLALQSAVLMSRFGAELYMGPVVALSVLRELGPVLTSILVGGRVASGITAEIGSMKETEQIDALRVIGVNYVKRLIVPRVLAALMVFPLLTVLADFLGIVGGMFIAVFERGLDYVMYWQTIFQLVVLRDLLAGLGKTPIFAALITLIGCYNGLRATGGTVGLGRATTATVVQVTLAVIISDFFLTRLFMLVGA